LVHTADEQACGIELPRLRPWKAEVERSGGCCARVVSGEATPALVRHTPKTTAARPRPTSQPSWLAPRPPAPAGDPSGHDPGGLRPVVGSGAGARAFTGWFGIRGIGSLYYVAAIIDERVLTEAEAKTVFWTVIALAGVSILAHGLTATSLTRRVAAPGAMES
jgi:hypothetical protein